MIEDVTRIICGLVRVAIGMPANSVRPGDQNVPAGSQTKEFATVKIISSNDLGSAQRSFATNLDGTLTERVDAVKEVVASVQFFRSPTADSAGIARYSRAAFDRATRLGQRLQMSASVELMRKLGLGLLEVGDARDLSQVTDATWESRGQIDLTFNVVSRESVVAPHIDSALVTVNFEPEQTRTFEVIP